jgi:hypothetical protein
MWTVICLIPAALLFAHQIRQSNTLRAATPTGTPVIVLIGEDLEIPQ